MSCLEMIFGLKVGFKEHCKSIIRKIEATIFLLCKFQCPRPELFTICISFVRTYLVYVNNIMKKFLPKKIESLQDNAVLAIANAVRGTPQEKISKVRFGVPSATIMVQKNLFFKMS